MIQLQDEKLARNLCDRVSKLGLRVVQEQQEVDVIICESELGGTSSAATLSVPCIILNQRDGVVDAVSLRHPIRRARLIDALCNALKVDLHGAQPSSPAPKRLHDPHKRQPGSPSLRRRILIVDDNVVNRIVTKRMLEQVGFASSAIYTASNGLEAIESLKHQKADIVFMDVEMPVMDGIESTREIRKSWTHDQMRIVACTATATAEQRAACSSAGMDNFLTKPLSYDALSELLGDL